jgi:PKD repeat protein
MTDVEYSPNGSFFAVSTTAAWGGMSSAYGGNGCDVVARFESASTSSTDRASWTAYTGGDSTWTIEVTDNVIYAGGHQSWQNNPIGRNAPSQGAVPRPGIAALNPVNGMAYSWNPTRTRGVGVQDMLATSQGLWVGSDTDRIGNYEYHARIALMPLQGGKTLPLMSNPSLPGTVYSVAVGGSQLVARSFNGTTATTPANAPNGGLPWSSTVGAFMTNGYLYAATSNGQFTKRSFDGTNYGPATAVDTADQLVYQSDWHNTDVPAIRSFFYHNGWMYYTRSDQNALLSRGFEVESDIVGQQRYTNTTSTGINYAAIRGAFVANGKFWFANGSGQLFRADWGGRAPVPGTAVQVSGPGIDAQNWTARAMFVLTGVGTPPPPPPNQPPSADFSASCNLLECTFDGTDSEDSDGTIESYEWDFGDGNTDSTQGETATHPYGAPGPYTVKLKVTDDDGASTETTRQVNPSDIPSPVAFVGANGTVGNRTNHAVTIPGTVQAGDAMVLFFTTNTTTPTYTWPAGWTEIEAVNASGFVGRAWYRVATAADAGTSVRVTSSGYAKSNIAVSAYRGTDATNPVAVSANRLDTSSGAAITSPTVTAPDGGGWLVTYWADKSSATTGWTAPAGQVQRYTGAGSPSGHVSALMTDSGGTVSGSTGGLTATASSTSTRRLSFSVVVH